jgi:hypothetical protein
MNPEIGLLKFCYTKSKRKGKVIRHKKIKQGVITEEEFSQLKTDLIKGQKGEADKS